MAKSKTAKAVETTEIQESNMGRPKAEIDRGAFEALMDLPFITCEAAAGVFGVCKETIVRFVKREYQVTFAELKEQKKENIKTKLAAKQYQIAMKGNVSMLIWLGKQYLEQKDKSEIKGELDIKLSLADRMAKARERLNKKE